MCDESRVRVSLERVTQQFRIYHERTDTLKEAFSNLFKSRGVYQDLVALDDVSMSVNQGETVGLIGRNGSGKSTILKLIGRIYSPTSGTVRVSGKVAPLIELGAGFHPELTGRENVFLNGAIMGFSKSEMRDKFEAIVDFAELWKFIDAPLKTYSSGMTMRLAFASATEADPDVLLIDEILAVGDAEFKGKCFNRLREFRQGGKTILFVSHHLELVRVLCHRVIVLDGGRIVAAGKPDEAIEEYKELISQPHTEVESINEAMDSLDVTI